jgi:hypothetical protein
MQSNLNNVYIKNTLKFLGNGTDLNLQIKSGTTDQLVIRANYADGALAFDAGTGGIVLDATMGTGATGSTAGPISLISKAASSWAVSNAALTLSAANTIETSASGSIAKTAASGMTLTATAGTLALAATAGATTETSGTTITKTGGTGMSLTSTAGTLALAATAGATTETSGTTITKTAGTSMSLDAATSASFGGSTATSVIIGNSSNPVNINGNTTTINGNLVVNGTTTSILSTTLLEADNLLVLNSSTGGVPVGAGNDGGLLIDRSAADIQANTTNDTPVSSGTTVGVTTGLANTTSITLGANTNYNGSYVALTSGLLTGQIRKLSAMTGSSGVATINSAWTPAALTGSTWAVSGTGLTAVGSSFTTQLSAGSNIAINGVNFVIVSVTNNTTAVVVSLSNTSAATATLITPGGGTTYNIYSVALVGVFWQESTKQFVFASTTADPGQGVVTIGEYLNVKMNSITTNSITISGTAAANWNGTTLTGSVVLPGGLGVSKNVIVRTDGAAVAQPPMSLTQTTTGQPVLTMIQNDPVQPVLSITGTSNGTNSLFGTTSAATLVSTSNGNNTNLILELQGLVQVSVTDTNVTTNGLASQSYYVPLYILT